MATPQHFLVALDGSPRSPHVLERAIAMARPPGAKIRLFRAVPVQPEVPWDLLQAFPAGGVEAVLSDHARRELDALVAIVPTDLYDGVEVAVGAPWKAICEAGRKYSADLIVIGSHGYHGMDRVLGTTAVRVVEHADRSVLVVHD